MVSLDRIHIIGAWYMSVHGGYKPRPDAFINYFKKHGMEPKRIFFLGNRLVDMKLASAVKRRLGCKIFKCLIIRDGIDSIGARYAHKIVKNLWEARSAIKKFKPDLVLSDFDNTLVHSGYAGVESAVEKLRFWEAYSRSRIARVLYGFFSQFSIPFLRKKPYISKYDNTEGFIRTMKPTLLIHTMSPETVVKLTLKKIIV